MTFKVRWRGSSQSGQDYNIPAKLQLTQVLADVWEERKEKGEGEGGEFSWKNKNLQSIKVSVLD